MIENYYIVLGLSANGLNENGEPYSRKEILQAFKKRTLITHPDKNVGNPIAMQNYHRITAAKDVLSDENERIAFDKKLNPKRPAYLPEECAQAIVASFINLGEIVEFILAQKDIPAVLEVLKKVPVDPEHCGKTNIPELIALFTPLLLSLPAEYKEVRGKFIKELKELNMGSPIDKLLQQYKYSAENLARIEQEQLKQQSQVAIVIKKLETHKDFLTTKGGEYTKKKNATKKDIYDKRAAAVDELLVDLENMSKAHYQQDFSATVPDKNALHLNLTAKIKEHLDKEETPLKKYADSRQVVYDVLAGLSWIFLPFSIPMRLYTGTFFYFNAKDNTERMLANHLGPELKKVLTA